MHYPDPVLETRNCQHVVCLLLFFSIIHAVVNLDSCAVKPNESTNQVVKTLAKHLNVHLDESHVSTSHRLATKPDGKRPPPIIVRFANRDKKNEIFGKRKMLQSNSMISSNFESDKVSIQENLTVYKKMLFNQAKIG